VSKRIAVITDATSAGFWFPTWYDYYSREFGADALHVVTYAGKRGDFKEFDLAGLWDVVLAYDDVLRAKLMSTMVQSLLLTHDFVVRCDVDEFLIPDVRKFDGLKAYLEQCALPYVSAYGVEVFEQIGAAPLDASQPILVAQRQRAASNSALNKIAVTSTPLDWWPGFHSANAAPAFDDLYLFHLKFADLGRRIAWFEHMRAGVPRESSEYAYFSATKAQMIDHQEAISEQPCRADGWSNLPDQAELQKFLATVTRSDDGCQQGEFLYGSESFLIPAEFRGKL